MTEESKTGCGCVTMIVLIIGVYCLIHAWCPSLDFMQMTGFAWVPTILIVGCVHMFFEEKIPTTKSKKQIAEEKRRDEERRQQTEREERIRKEEERHQRERRERMDRERERWTEHLRQERQAREERENAARREQYRAQNQERFLSITFSMLTKLAKADGRVDKEEVEAINKIFTRFDFADRRRKFCSVIFNSAKDDSCSIYRYAERFRDHVTDPEVCTFVYELLWDVACADGWLHPAEKEILEKICSYLHVPEAYYHINYRRRRGTFTEGDKQASKQSAGRGEYKQRTRTRDWRRPYVSGRSSILEAYEILECEISDSDEILRSAYRKIAKRYHPDLLRANGVPEEMIAEATARMAQVNVAWEDICKARGI